MLAWIAKPPIAFAPNVAATGMCESLPNFVHDIWAGIFVRKAAPNDITAAINTAMADLRKVDEVRTVIGNAGSRGIKGTSADDADQCITGEMAKLLSMTNEMEFEVQ
jgi:tripartite-type tricarboxylate transporter receptor subunit TctC